MTRLYAPLLPMVFLLAACAPGTAGRYVLQTVGGEPLPQPWQPVLKPRVAPRSALRPLSKASRGNPCGCPVRQLLAMVFQFESDGTCTLTNTLRSENGEVAEVDDAYFSVTLVNQGGANAPTITGSIADGTLTLSALDGAPLVYTRQ